ncbi:MAG: phosphodiester glycosidase family protein [Clostridia bacterium]|nr:phosphodiester glycosidase family protein [Clostridia bacterium]
MNQLMEKEYKVENSDNKSNRNSNKRRKKKKGILKKLIIAFFILVFIGAGALAALLYGPNHTFRDWLITTAMTTMRHQWIAHLFYSDDIINEVMKNNKVEEIDEDTNTDAINIGEKTEQYENEYEKAILEKKNPDDKYKVIEISGNGYSGYLAAVYDPSKIHTLVTAKIGTSGQYLTTMAKNNKAIIAINGGGFYDPNYNSNGANPLGITYSKGKQYTSKSYSGPGGIIGFDYNDKLILSSKCNVQSAKDLNIRDCVTCGPFLIVNGKASTVVGNGGWGTAPRTAIGQRKDGIVLFLVIDGRKIGRQGADMDDLIEIMQNYGAVNAANLDGGTSTAMVVNYELINDPIDSTGAHKTRFISTGIGLIDE